MYSSVTFKFDKNNFPEIKNKSWGGPNISRK